MQVRVKLRVAGWKHHISYAEAKGLARTAYLLREPDNPFDVNAVAVAIDDDHKIGYITMEHSALIASIMDEGHRITTMVFTDEHGSFSPCREDPDHVVDWAHISVTLTIDAPSDAIAIALCRIMGGNAVYVVDGHLMPANRTRADWKTAHRYVRPRSTPIDHTQKGVALYSVADLTVPPGARTFPGTFG